MVKNRVYVLIEGNIPFDTVEDITKTEYDRRKEKGHICSTVLIETEGRFILIDPGVDRDYERLESTLNKIRKGKGRKGLSFKDIDYLIATHDHKDHCGNIEVLVRQFSTQVLDNKAFVKEKKREELEPGEGVWVWRTIGHTRGHVSVLVKDAAVYYLKGKKFVKEGEYENLAVAGDAVVSKELFYENLVFPFSENRNAAQISMGKIARIADYIIPGHSRGFEVKRESIKAVRPTEESFENLIKTLEKMNRDRDIITYERMAKERRITPPKLKQGFRVLDMGCGRGNAMVGMIDQVCGGYCSNKKCQRYSDYPYAPDSLETLVDRKCNYQLSDGAACDGIIQTGRVIGVDYSEKTLEETENTLRRKLKKKYGNKFKVIRASTKELLSKKGKLDRLFRSALRDRIKNFDRLDNRKTILLYQERSRETVNLPPGYFNVIYCVYLLTYERDPIETILDLIHMLKVGGEIMIMGSEPFVISDKKLTNEQTKQLEKMLYGENLFELHEALDKLNFGKLYYIQDFLKELSNDIDGFEIENGRHKTDIVIRKTEEIDVHKIAKKFGHYYTAMPKIPSYRINAFYVRK